MKARQKKKGYKWEKGRLEHTLSYFCLFFLVNMPMHCWVPHTVFRHFYSHYWFCVPVAIFPTQVAASSVSCVNSPICSFASYFENRSFYKKIFKVFNWHLPILLFFGLSTWVVFSRVVFFPGFLMFLVVLCCDLYSRWNEYLIW